MTLALLALLATMAQPPQVETVERFPSVEAVTVEPAAALGDPGPGDPADSNDPDDKPPTPPHTGVRALLDGLRLDITHLPSTSNLVIALAGGGAALAVHPFDQGFNARLVSHYDTLDDLFAAGKYIGNTPEQVAFSLGTYAFGRFFDEPKVSHLGMDLLRAQIIAELFVEPLKYTVRRERPDGSNSQSFPSGHAAVTFATATVIERHLGWKYSVLAYSVAAYVAVSRLHDDVHYLSDVVFGSALGVIAGRTVTEHGRETWTMAPAFEPGGGAVFVVWTP
jgi:membrane-associated phospholipid phosphatase